MKRMKFLMVAVAATFLAANVSAQDITTMNQKYAEAIEALNARDNVKAIALFEEVLEGAESLGEEGEELVKNIKNTLPQVYYRAGGALAQAGNYEEAVGYFEKTVTSARAIRHTQLIDNGTKWVSNSYMKLGGDAFNAEDYATAVQFFAKGYAANPNDTQLALNLAKSYSELGDTEQGFQVYRDIIALGDSHSMYAEDAATAKSDYAYYAAVKAGEAATARDFDTAYAIMDEVLAVDPANPTINLMYLQTATNQQNWDKVIEKGEAAAEAQADDAAKSNAYFYLGAAYQNKDNKAKAIESYRKVTAGDNVSRARTEITELSK